MPCSATSRPAVSTCSSTRMPQSRFSVQSAPNDRLNVNTPTMSKAEGLHAELVEAARVEETAGARSEVRCERRDREQAHCERPPHAGHSVHRDGANRIVDPDPLDPEHAHDRERRRNDADHDRGPRRHEARRGGDRHQRRDHPVQHHRHIRLAEHEPRCADPAERARRGGQVRREGDVGEVADLVAGHDAQRRARVEAEPAEPEDHVPRTAYGMLWPGIGFARPSWPNLPIRGPSSSAPASAASAPW